MPESAAPHFQFSLLQWIVAVLAASVLLGFLIYFPMVTGPLLSVAVVAGIFAIAYWKWPDRTVLFCTIGLVALIALSLTSRTKGQIPGIRAQLMLKNLAMMIDAYHVEHGAYPPDTNSNMGSSETLYYYLCVQQRAANENIYPAFDANANGLMEFVSQCQRILLYARLKEGNREGYVLIDPGQDGLLGGIIDPQRGFISDGSDANRDGIPDDKDNLIESSLDPEVK